MRVKAHEICIIGTCLLFKNFVVQQKMRAGTFTSFSSWDITHRSVDTFSVGFMVADKKIISSFLSSCFISVVVDTATSASFSVSSGVLQGSFLSPTLFLLFINDLHASVSDVHSFVDDSILHKSSSFQSQLSFNARSQSRLAVSLTINSDLQSISEWGTRNLVEFNTSRIQLLTFSVSNIPSNCLILFEDSEI